MDNIPKIIRKTITQIEITIHFVFFFFGVFSKVVSLLFSIICFASSKTSSVSVEEVSELYNIAFIIKFNPF